MLQWNRLRDRAALLTLSYNLQMSTLKVGHSLELGDIILEVNDIAIRSAEDLQALVAMADKRIVFLVKKTPEQARSLRTVRQCKSDILTSLTLTQMP